MCSVPGYDASGRGEDLAAEQNTQITSIAIGKSSLVSVNMVCSLKSVYLRGLRSQLVASIEYFIILSACRFCRGFQPGRESHKYCCQIWQVSYSVDLTSTICSSHI